ncbi:hypothetical protein V8C86DRAFT_2713039, partial [Haematococcus lacustris]
MRWANLAFLPWYVLSLSPAARASPEVFLLRSASVSSGCSASSRSSMSLSGSSGTGLGTVRLFFLAIDIKSVKTSQILE